jgi:hypothetical protein
LPAIIQDLLEQICTKYRIIVIILDVGLVFDDQFNLKKKYMDIACAWDRTHDAVRAMGKTILITARLAARPLGIHHMTRAAACFIGLQR